MAGRRRTGALAGAVDLAGQLILHKQQEEQRQMERSEELAQRFAYDMAIKQFEQQLTAARTQSVIDALQKSGVGSAESGYLPPDVTVGPSGVSTTYRHAPPLTPSNQLIADMRKAEEVAAVEEEAATSMRSTVRGAQPFAYGVSEQAMENRPSSLLRSMDIVNAPAVKAHQQLGVLRGIAQRMSNLGILGRESAPGLDAPALDDSARGQTVEALPDPSTLPEGQTATDTATGQRYIVSGGQWVPL